MSKLTSYSDLESYKAKILSQQQMRMKVLVCAGPGCQTSKSGKIIEKLNELVAANNITDVEIVQTGCFGFCEQGPSIKVEPENIYYVKLTPEDAEIIFEQHILGGKVVEKLLYIDPETNKVCPKEKDIDFYKYQEKIALRNCGEIDPENIGIYISRDGYFALAKCLTELTPAGIVDIVKGSELRGRGGGGFPTGLKWELAAKSQSDIKYVVCNADEGDPGAFMDRSIMEGDPNSVIEAMIICGRAIGASKGIIYVRAEYPLAVKRLEIAMQQAEELGLLGENILGSGFNFNIEIIFGAGAFVCGEETSLMNSVQGERGEPRMKPPFPAVSGVWGKPTNINNVETYANIPPIILKGADWFAGIGTEKSRGTKVFALAGKINNVGLTEVPMGIPLKDIIYKIGGGIKDGREFKAVQTGGPSGGCIPKQHLDLPIDYDNLSKIGSMMGSGGMIVMDDTDCMVDVAKFFLEFTVDESCGKCTPCRIGNLRLHEILERISKGNGTSEDLDKLKELGEIIKDTSLCGLGQSSPNPILSTLEFFREEYEKHVEDKKCPAGKCTALKKYVITDKCIGCTLCARKCPVDCISGVAKEKHLIDQERCIKCGTCKEVCPVNAIEVI